MCRCPLRSTLFPYTTLFRSVDGLIVMPAGRHHHGVLVEQLVSASEGLLEEPSDRQPPGGSSRRPSEADTSCRSEEHTSELQSRVDLVCRLLLEKKKKSKSEG